MTRLDPADLDRLLGRELDMAFRRRARTIVEWLDPAPGQRILDVGCGRGFYLRLLRALCPCPLTGIEPELSHLGKARRHLRGMSGINLIAAQLPRLPFADGSFDGIIFSEVLEHVADEAAALAEVARLLRPGGVLALTVPHANYPLLWDPINKALEGLGLGPLRRGPLAGIWALHERLYTMERLRELAAACGLTILEERSQTHHTVPFVHNLLYGLGKPLLEGGWLWGPLARAADRGAMARDAARPSPLNPVGLALRLLTWGDRKNRPSEPEGRSSVNLCLKLTR